MNGAYTAAQNLQNLSIPITSPQIIYTPFVCNSSLDGTESELCSGAWHLSDNSISTTGPNSSSKVLQMFLQVQASRITMTTLPTSVASVNITLSGGGLQISRVFKSSLGSLSVVNLPQNQTTHLVITYISSEAPALFAVESFYITVPENAPLSSVLPYPPLPTFSYLPSSTLNSSTSSATALPTISKKSKVGLAIGLTLGLALVLTAIGCGMRQLYLCGRRRKEKKRT